MMTMTRREFIRIAASFGASLALGSNYASDSKIAWRERRDIFPQGVASGDPHPDGVILWTRRPPAKGSESKQLILEIAEDMNFHRVVATAKAEISADTDWTCRVFAARLQPRRIYWYRFTDEYGFGSRIGRTITAPADKDVKPVAFAFVSCQNVQQGACNAYRRMIWEDEQRAPDEQLGFVLHLGDFVYELVWYPEDRPQGMYDRRLRDIVRYPNGQKFDDFHFPMTVEDYRTLYRGYLTDQDLQDARARWPFICVWDNHEFSWKGWQSQQDIGGVRPAQRIKVAANQAWFEYQPARVVQHGNSKRDRFEAPSVANAPITHFDEHGLGLEPGNIAAINSLKVFRSLRYGRNMELVITDNHSFRSELITRRTEADPFQPKEFPNFFPQDVMEILDAGQAYQEGRPPNTIHFDGADVPNPRKKGNPQSILGIVQKQWFLEQLSASTAPWKLWGNSMGMLDCRVDLQNLPADSGVHWPSTSYGIIGDDWSAYCYERAEILDFVKRKKITGLVTIAGDRHAFFAGVLSATLPPEHFEPVAAEFIGGSISAPGLVEALSYKIKKDDPIRPVFLYETSTDAPSQPAINFSIMHGIRSGLALSRTHEMSRALAEHNPEVSPHLSFVDLCGHGYSIVRVDQEHLEAEFICIPRPLERSERADGGPLLYRITHRIKLWKPGDAPRLEQKVLEGSPASNQT